MLGDIFTVLKLDAFSFMHRWGHLQKSNLGLGGRIKSWGKGREEMTFSEAFPPLLVTLY